MRTDQVLAHPLVDGTLGEATGRRHRPNAVLPRTGGPAGNAALTAWTGLVLLVLFVAELLTLFDVRGLISWHVAIGALLVPPALLKTASTGWRMVRYYTGHGAYREAGAPPTLLRWLGPLVVLSTLGLLASGILLVVLGAGSAHTTLVSLPDLRVDWVTLHQAFFAVWCGATGLHLLARIVPALRATVLRARGSSVPGRVARLALVPVVAFVAAGLAVLVVGAATSW